MGSEGLQAVHIKFTISLLLMRSDPQLMKESTVASSKLESDRAKKRYVRLHRSVSGSTDNFYRLRTRIAFVQNSEEALAEKRNHCASFSTAVVVAAADASHRQGSCRCISKCYGFTWGHMKLWLRLF
jgi:hypothetical protein